VKHHVKVYMEAFGYGEQDFIPCEVCFRLFGRRTRAVDVHHIDPRGMGGSKLKDTPDNLIGVCRDCHDVCERYPTMRSVCRNIVERRELTRTNEQSSRRYEQYRL
jgi:predicted HNH restriction endonuclease